jgi:hypothetical protein
MIPPEHRKLSLTLVCQYLVFAMACKPWQHNLAAKPLQVEFFDKIVIYIIRQQFTINANFTHTTRNELRILRAEIKNKDFVVVNPIEKLLLNDPYPTSNLII